jgi:rare lipoprotein A
LPEYITSGQTNFHPALSHIQADLARFSAPQRKHKGVFAMRTHLFRFVMSAAVLAGASAVQEAAANDGKSQLIQRGQASWYHHGKRTANGEAFRPDGMTAAHRSLPFGTRVRVVNERTGRSVVVRINDRGPFTGGRVIDLSRGSARALGVSGVSRVALHRLD